MNQTDLTYKELDVSIKNKIASTLGSKLREHIQHLANYRYFVNNDEFIVLTQDNNIVAKNIRTTTFIYSITDYSLLEPRLKRDEIPVWEDAGFVINKRLLKIANEDNVTPTIFPMKYLPSDTVRQYNKEILDQYKIPRGLNPSAIKAASKLIPGLGSSKLPGISAANKNMVIDGVNKIMKQGTTAGELQSLIEQAVKGQKNKAKRRQIKY